MLCLLEKLINMCLGENELLYIGGQEILPPPLEKVEEEELLLKIAKELS